MFSSFVCYSSLASLIGFTIVVFSNERTTVDLSKRCSIAEYNKMTTPIQEALSFGLITEAKTSLVPDPTDQNGFLMIEVESYITIGYEYNIEVCKKLCSSVMNRYRGLSKIFHQPQTDEQIRTICKWYIALNEIITKIELVIFSSVIVLPVIFLFDFMFCF